ncbi:hypothetical protein BDV95DRAFT_253190 [Massariosphaeria phaeospora]|uniref:Uncharacterized protein n=1 Tax=Massariosphaeria phaeospora TaxID=100035 RepID=A0A7C8I1E6_9PLEO|nr:hypothetical protein BDV95DRAFT_253190 [Massariosphaeria phaeospora]
MTASTNRATGDNALGEAKQGRDRAEQRTSQSTCRPRSRCDSPLLLSDIRQPRRPACDDTECKHYLPDIERTRLPNALEVQSQCFINQDPISDTFFKGRVHLGVPELCWTHLDSDITYSVSIECGDTSQFDKRHQTRPANYPVDQCNPPPPLLTAYSRPLYI